MWSTEIKICWLITINQLQDKHMSLRRWILIFKKQVDKNKRHHNHILYNKSTYSLHTPRIDRIAILSSVHKQIKYWKWGQFEFKLFILFSMGKITGNISHFGILMALNLPTWIENYFLCHVISYSFANNFSLFSLNESICRNFNTNHYLRLRTSFSSLSTLTVSCICISFFKT